MTCKLTLGRLFADERKAQVRWQALANSPTAAAVSTTSSPRSRSGTRPSCARSTSSTSGAGAVSSLRLAGLPLGGCRRCAPPRSSKPFVQLDRYIARNAGAFNFPARPGNGMTHYTAQGPFDHAARARRRARRWLSARRPERAGAALPAQFLSDPAWSEAAARAVWWPIPERHHPHDAGRGARQQVRADLDRRGLAARGLPPPGGDATRWLGERGVDVEVEWACAAASRPWPHGCARCASAA